MKKILFRLGVLVSLGTIITTQLPAQTNSPDTGETSVKRYLTGDPADVQTPTRAGLLLAGGSTDQDAAMKWMIERSGGGDVVVIRSSGADGYNDYIYSLGTVNSVETIIINSRQKAMLPEVAASIRHAEMLFIAGGDQWNYVNYWRNTPVEEAINYLINIKKVPVGGTSAGCAILGEFYFSAQYGTIRSEEALQSPWHVGNAIGRSDFIEAPILKQTITDSHYTQRNRQGRHISWLARLIRESQAKTVRGIGVDEKTAVAIDENGIATVFGKHDAWFIWTNQHTVNTCEPGAVLHWDNKKAPAGAYIIKGSDSGNGRIDLKDWKKMEGGRRIQIRIRRGTLVTDSV
ncbi:MAG TPA: cyanophycinase [Flavihumibacter sp.]